MLMICAAVRKGDIRRLEEADKFIPKRPRKKTKCYDVGGGMVVKIKDNKAQNADGIRSS